MSQSSFLATSNIPTRLKFVCPLLLFIFTSCEGYRSAQGQVLDRATLQPIDSVKCEVITGSLQSYTDSNGHFAVSNRMGGCLPKCKDIMVRLSKKDYKDLIVTNPTDTVFYLER